jgi:hypothetical protein
MLPSLFPDFYYVQMNFYVVFMTVLITAKEVNYQKNSITLLFLA